MNSQLCTRRPATADLPIRPGEPTQIAAGVWRLTCRNPGAMTGPGTNSYLIDACGTWTVIDPGPMHPEHVQALCAAAAGPIGQILVTHSHPDHSPAAVALRALTGARLLGRSGAHARGHDRTFVPDQELSDGQSVPLGPGTVLRVIHTPGHAANHLCYLLAPLRLLFTGDHIIQGSTVVIDPPDGNMSDYFASLERLLREDLAVLAPGHGTLIEQPHAALRALIAHRLQREAQVLAALCTGRPASLSELVDRVYRDLPATLHRLAERSVLAHLLRLEAAGCARRYRGRWRS